MPRPSTSSRSLLVLVALKPRKAFCGSSFDTAIYSSDESVKETLLYGLSLNHAELRNVISSIIATSSVSPDGVQPYLHIGQWP
jgi:hypothetical protein